MQSRIGVPEGKDASQHRTNPVGNYERRKYILRKEMGSEHLERGESV